jgi:cytochrome oxidase Cu insertion factor (SCO1/SenC/PrrC family)
MKARLLAALSLSIFLAGAAAFAQLSPKEPTTQPATDLNRVKVGQAAPDFALEDSDGKAISLSDFRAKKSVVLVFYRGYW